MDYMAEQTAPSTDKPTGMGVSHAPITISTREDRVLESMPPSFAGMDAALALIAACDAHLRHDKTVKIRLGFNVTPAVEIEITNRITN